MYFKKKTLLFNRIILNTILILSIGCLFDCNVNNEENLPDIINEQPEQSEPATELKLFWGDIHCHTSNSFDGMENANSPGQALAYGRDVTKLDFVALTDHGEQMDEEEWKEYQNQINNYNEPGVFVTYTGYEFTKKGTENTDGGGHKQVIFKNDNVIGIPFSSSISKTAGDLWNAIKGYECITIAHTSAQGGEGSKNHSSDWAYVNAEIQPLIEIYSFHGNNESAGCEEPVRSFIDDRSVESALLKWIETGDDGYKLGITGSTDGHKGRPGAVEEIEDNLAFGKFTGGLVAVYAEEKTRDSIFNAFISKRTYATSGPRIELEFSININNKTYVMGETIEADKNSTISLKISSKGQDVPIEKIQIIKNGILFEEIDSNEHESSDIITNERTYYRVKVFQTPTLRWDGELMAERAWSSPIWIISK